MSDIFEGTTANTAGTSSTLTYQKILDVMKAIEALPPVPPQVKLIESWMAIRRERARRYPKSRAKSERHWRRMDKKWLKRYGHRDIPTSYSMKMPNAFGAQELVVFVHPQLMPKFRRALRRNGEP